MRDRLRSVPSRREIHDDELETHEKIVAGTVLAGFMTLNTACYGRSI